MQSCLQLHSRGHMGVSFILERTAGLFSLVPMAGHGHGTGTGSPRPVITISISIAISSSRSSSISIDRDRVHVRVIMRMRMPAPAPWPAPWRRPVLPASAYIWFEFSLIVIWPAPWPGACANRDLYIGAGTAADIMFSAS